MLKLTTQYITKIYVGEAQNQPRDLQIQHIEQWAKAWAIGSYTLIDGRGYWYNGNKQITEKTTIIEIISDFKMRITNRELTDLVLRTNQEALLVTRQTIDTELITQGD